MSILLALSDVTFDIFFPKVQVENDIQESRSTKIRVFDPPFLATRQRLVSSIGSGRWRSHSRGATLGKLSGGVWSEPLYNPKGFEWFWHVLKICWLFIDIDEWCLSFQIDWISKMKSPYWIEIIWPRGSWIWTNIDRSHFRPVAKAKLVHDSQWLTWCNWKISMDIQVFHFSPVMWRPWIWMNLVVYYIS